MVINDINKEERKNAHISVCQVGAHDVKHAVQAVQPMLLLTTLFWPHLARSSLQARHAGGSGAQCFPESLLGSCNPHYTRTQARRRHVGSIRAAPPAVSRRRIRAPAAAAGVGPGEGSGGAGRAGPERGCVPSGASGTWPTAGRLAAASGPRLGARGVAMPGEGSRRGLRGRRGFTARGAGGRPSCCGAAGSARGLGAARGGGRAGGGAGGAAQRPAEDRPAARTRKGGPEGAG